MDTTVQSISEFLRLFADRRGLGFRRCLFSQLICFIFLTVVLPARADNWPEWLGADGDGFSDESAVPAVWSDKQNVL